MPKDNTQEVSEPSEPAAPAAVQEPTLPPGSVVLTKAEHDRLQGASRKASRLEREKEDRESQERAEAARAAGEFDKALAEERRGKDDLRRKLQEHDVRDAVRDRIAELGYSGSRAIGLLRLVDPAGIPVEDGNADPAAVEAAVSATIEKFPDLFRLEEEPGSGREASMPGRRSPAVPDNDQYSGTPSDYVSPEEYVRTPHKVRLTRAFQERVENSRPYWPTKVPASTFS